MFFYSFLNNFQLFQHLFYCTLIYSLVIYILLVLLYCFCTCICYLAQPYHRELSFPIFHPSEAGFVPASNKLNNFMAYYFGKTILKIVVLMSNLCYFNASFYIYLCSLPFHFEV